MKKHKFCLALLFLQVCSLGFAESRQHRRFGGGNGKSPRLHAGAIERDEYSGKKCAFEAQRGLAQARDHASHSGSCPHCHRNRGASVAADSDLHDTRVARAPKRPLEHFDAVVKRARVDEARAPHHAAVRKRPLLARVSAREAANSPDMAPYGAPQQAAYPPQGQDPGMGAPPGAYGAAPAQYPGPGQPEYAPQGPAQYPQQPQDAYAGAPAPQAAPYTPEQYPAPGSLPPPAGQYPAPYPGMAPDGVNAPQDQMAPAQYPYPNQGLAPSPFNQGSGLSSSHESDPNDVHNSWKCMLLPFFFPECNRVDVKPLQNPGMGPPPSSPVSQQYCNMYGTGDLNLSDFASNSDQWLVVNENNSLRLTSNRPVQESMQSLELKGNFCNKENLSCMLQLGENSTAGLSVRGSADQKTLVEFNSLTRSISLKQVTGGTTQVLLEQPFPKLNPNFLHLVQVNDGGFQGNLSVFVDGELVFSKNDLPTQATGTMGLFITSGNATFGNFSVTPVS